MDALGGGAVVAGVNVLTGFDVVIAAEGFEFFSPIRICDVSKTTLLLLFSLGSPDFFSLRNQDDV